jgi:hypothetical protein
MTPQEQTMLGDLIRRIQTTTLTEKDPEAQNLIDQQLGGHPDALYVLAQTVLVQNYALEQAQRQLEQLKQQAATAAQPAKATSFLGSIFGHSDAPKPAAPAPAYAQGPPATQWSTPQGGQGYPPQYPPQQYAPQGYPAQGYPAQAYPAPAGGSSFLRSAATTAAGVAAGALAFEGVESLMHGFGHEAGFGGGGFGGMGGGYGAPVEETVVNNYYDSPGGERGEYRDDARNDDRGGYQNDRFDNDASSRDMPALHDASYTGPQSDDNLQPQDDLADDVNVSDDSSYDDSSSDSGGGDDSSFV